MKQHTFYVGKVAALAALGWLAVWLTGCDLGGYDGPGTRFLALSDEERDKIAYNGSETLRFKIYGDNGEVSDTMTFTAPDGLEERVSTYDGGPTGITEYENLYIKFNAQEDPEVYFSLEIRPWRVLNVSGITHSMIVTYNDDFILEKWNDDISEDDSISMIGTQNSKHIMYSRVDGIIEINSPQPLTEKL